MMVLMRRLSSSRAEILNRADESYALGCIEDFHRLDKPDAWLLGKGFSDLLC